MYAWQRIEQAKESGLFKKFKWFWVWAPEWKEKLPCHEPEIVAISDIGDFLENLQGWTFYVAPISTRPRPRSVEEMKAKALESI